MIQSIAGGITHLHSETYINASGIVAGTCYVPVVYTMWGYTMLHVAHEHLILCSHCVCVSPQAHLLAVCMYVHRGLCAHYWYSKCSGVRSSWFSTNSWWHVNVLFTSYREVCCSSPRCEISKYPAEGYEWEVRARWLGSGSRSWPQQRCERIGKQWTGKPSMISFVEIHQLCWVSECHFKALTHTRFTVVSLYTISYCCTNSM